MHFDITNSQISCILVGQWKCVYIPLKIIVLYIRGMSWQCYMCSVSRLCFRHKLLQTPPLPLVVTRHIDAKISLHMRRSVQDQQGTDIPAGEISKVKMFHIQDQHPTFLSNCWSKFYLLTIWYVSNSVLYYFISFISVVCECQQCCLCDLFLGDNTLGHLYHQVMKYWTLYT